MADPLPPASFANFLVGLRTQGLMQVGAIPHPHLGRREANPPYARYTIELLRILRDKTEGRRSQDETDLLDGSIRELEHLLEHPPGQPE